MAGWIKFLHPSLDAAHALKALATGGGVRMASPPSPFPGDVMGAMHDPRSKQLAQRQGRPVECGPICFSVFCCRKGGLSATLKAYCTCKVDTSMRRAIPADRDVQRPLRARVRGIICLLSVTLVRCSRSPKSPARLANSLTMFEAGAPPLAHLAPLGRPAPRAVPSAYTNDGRRRSVTVTSIHFPACLTSAECLYPFTALLLTSKGHSLLPLMALAGLYHPQWCPVTRPYLKVTVAGSSGTGSSDHSKLMGVTAD